MRIGSDAKTGITIFVCLLAVALSLLLVAVLASKRPANPVDSNTVISVEKIEELAINNSNGMLIFNRKGDCFISNRSEWYSRHPHSLGSLYRTGEILHPVEMKKLGTDVFFVPLPEGLGQRYTREFARNLIADSIKRGSYKDRYLP